MLQIAAPEAIVRLGNTPLASEISEIEKIYFVNQCHQSIDEFLSHYIDETASPFENGLLIQVLSVRILSG